MGRPHATIRRLEVLTMKRYLVVLAVVASLIVVQAGHAGYVASCPCGEQGSNELLAHAR